MSIVGPEGRSFAKFSSMTCAVWQCSPTRIAAIFPAISQLGAPVSGPCCLRSTVSGRALHFTSGGVGINDFDVYTFYAQHPARAWYAKRRRVCDFGDPKFGQSDDKPDFVGRRVDLMSREIAAALKDEPAGAVQRYLADGASRVVSRRGRPLKCARWARQDRQ